MEGLGSDNHDNNDDDQVLQVLVMMMMLMMILKAKDSGIDVDDVDVDDDDDDDDDDNDDDNERTVGGLTAGAKVSPQRWWQPHQGIVNSTPCNPPLQNALWYSAKYPTLCTPSRHCQPPSAKWTL